MESTAFITLEDISDQLPSYDETVIQVEMDSVLAEAYTGIEEEIREALEQHRGNKSLMSIMLNTLLLYPDHPYGIDAIWGKQFDPQQGCTVPFLVTVPPNSQRRKPTPKNGDCLRMSGGNSARADAAKSMPPTRDSGTSQLALRGFSSRRASELRC